MTSASHQAPIFAERLTKHFGAVRAVDGVSFAIGAGQVVGLLGGNGAGKTTTIAMLLGLLLPSGGLAQVLGHDMARRRYKALPAVNFSSPYAELPGRLTVWENLRVYAGLYGVPRPRQRIRDLAVELDLAGLMHRRTSTLSAGQKSRLSLAKALLNRPKVLFLDEPTASLDPDTADWIRGYLEDYQRQTGAAILLASHNMPEVERLCDRVLMMSAGRIVAEGAPADLIRRYGRRDLEEVFLAIARGARGAGAPVVADGAAEGGIVS
ncbi:MAG: ABC transporter ATP-binding protein [Alphaproteobacteria bacterium]|nr:ABC transporter ATP-binding protein [Alphaproteobacteria bacterium]MCB9928701.1 ABC transporter ATP-binding protein [Alphaproteobacteria bacterium]